MVSAAIAVSLAVFTASFSVPTAIAADSSGFPEGVTSFAPQTPDPFCAQFKNVPAANGTQLKTGGRSCSSTQLGLLPDIDKMVSTLIIAPAAGSTVDASQSNTVMLDNSNLDSGFFNLANEQYYMAPQTLQRSSRFVQGHQHIVVQKLVQGSTTPPNPKIFAFFKGVNDAATDNQKRLLSATIPAGTLKENGLYRICTMTGVDAHQPHVQGTFKRGPQDDCIRVTVNNAIGAANQKVAADTAQNLNITINETNTTLSSNLTDTSPEVQAAVIASASVAAAIADATNTATIDSSTDGTGDVIDSSTTTDNSSTTAVSSSPTTADSITTTVDSSPTTTSGSTSSPTTTSSRLSTRSGKNKRRTRSPKRTKGTSTTTA